MIDKTCSTTSDARGCSAAFQTRERERDEENRDRYSNHQNGEVCQMIAFAHHMIVRQCSQIASRRPPLRSHVLEYVPVGAGESAVGLSKAFLELEFNAHERTKIPCQRRLVHCQREHRC